MDTSKGKAQDKLQVLLKNKWMLYGLGAVGALLILNPLSYFNSAGTPTPPAAAVEEGTVVNTARPTMAQYEKTYEARLTEILNTVRGVSDVSVMVNIESSEETIFAEDVQDRRQTTQENEAKGGTRTITNVDRSGKIVMTKEGGADQPVVVKTVKPRVRGVVVTARGAEDVKVQKVIMDAVQRALEVPPHKISILPKKQQQS